MKKFFRKIGRWFSGMDKLTKIIFIVFVVLAITTSVAAYNAMRNLTSSMTILNLPGVPLLQKGKKETSAPISQPAVNLPEPWDGVSRVTVLIMGLDSSDWRAGETPHSDTMILISLDPISKTASMLSIPRDMWVNIRGFGYGRINEAYFNGEAFNLPGGGPELARQTVEQFIGVPVQYYAVIDFAAFIRFIDEIGGINVTPDEPVTIEKEGSVQQEVLEPGVTYALDGELALAYIRERHTSGGDVDRARRQQEAILAIRHQLLKSDNLPKLIAKAPALYQDISSGIITNLDLKQAIQLGMLGVQLDLDNIKRGIIDYNMVTMFKTADGEQVLKPIVDQIRLLRDELFTSGTKGPIAQPVEGSTLVKDEAARVVILDGVGDASLANRTADYFRAEGINVVQVADAGGYLPGTKIEIFNGKPYSVKYLAELMNVASANIWNTFDPTAGFDIRVTLGGDWASNNPLQ